MVQHGGCQWLGRHGMQPGHTTTSAQIALLFEVAGRPTLVAVDAQPQIPVTTSPQQTSAPSSPRASAQGSNHEPRQGPPSPRSPALSEASTADGEDDIDSSPGLPHLPAPKLPGRAQELLRSPPPASTDENQFGTASWGSPYPRTDRNLRRQSFSSDASDDSPLHQLEIETPFLRPAPELIRAQPPPPLPVSAAAEVLANRVRRQNQGLTEDWIRAHTAGDLNTEPRHWFSDGSGSEHSSLSGSESGWLEERDPRTPRATILAKAASRRSSRHPRGRSSIETLKPGNTSSPVKGQSNTMAAVEAEQAVDATTHEQVSNVSTPLDEVPPRPTTPISSPSPVNGATKPPVTPTRPVRKQISKELVGTPRIKKKVPWKGKNILVLLPRDDERGLPDKAPKPLRREEINRMFSSWEELGYSVDGFDLLVEAEQPTGTDDSQSRSTWPDFDDLAKDRAQRNYKVALPDLNAWENYANEVQEAKLRALGVFTAEEEPPAPPSPPTTNPSRQPSAQYPPLPFSPPLPTSSASSHQGLPSFPFSQFTPTNMQSPGIPTGASPVPFGVQSGKFNPRQSISFSGNNSPFQMPQQYDPTALSNLTGMMSPQSPFGLEGFQPGSPAFNMQQRSQSLQYPMLPHQQMQHQQSMRESPRLQEVHEDDEDANKSPSKTPEPLQRNVDTLQAEIDDAEYHLEEQLRNELEHDDYHPHAQPEQPAEAAPLAGHERQQSGALPVPEHFANEPTEPLVLHHPRPHSRGHSLSQNFFRDHNQSQANAAEVAGTGFEALNNIPENNKAIDAQEIETNPSNLGTPVHDFDFSATLQQHEKTASSASNPWNDEASTTSNSRRKLSHESKPSLSKLNVKAPEFKFNPASTFTPGQFSFSGTSFQPTMFQAGANNSGNDIVSSLPNSVASLSQVPEFVPGHSDFSFTSSGPQFRPDAPSFMPLQSLEPVVANRSVSGKGHAPRDSIFGNIQIPTSDIVKPAKKSKAIPIVRPSSTASAASPKIIEENEEFGEDIDRRPVLDDSRIKRARSQAPDGDEAPLFAPQPTEDLVIQDVKAEPTSLEDSEPVGEDAQDDADNAIAADTSLSSAITSEQMDTKATTAAPSETSPVDDAVNRWAPFEFGTKMDASTFNTARPFGEDVFKENSHEKTLSATAAPFTPGASFSDQSFAKYEDKTKQDETAPEESTPIAEKTKTPPPAVAEAAPKPKPPKPKGLAASRYASEPSPVEAKAPAISEPVPALLPSVESPEEQVVASVEKEAESLIDLQTPVTEAPKLSEPAEPTFEEIDEVMQHLENDPTMGVNRYVEATQEREYSPQKAAPLADVQSPTYKLEPPRAESRQQSAISSQHYNEELDASPLMTTELEDPFLDPTNISPQSPHTADELEEPKSPISDWEAAFSADEPDKLESRAQFFDGRVNDMVGNLLASRLEPMEKALSAIQNALILQPGLAATSRRELRSKSAETRESDADDEDEEPIPRRSMSPRRDRKMEQIRSAVLDAMATQQRLQPAALVEERANEAPAEGLALFQAITEMKEQMGTSLRPQFDSDELRSMIEHAVQSKVPSAPEPDVELSKAMVDLQNKMSELEERLEMEQDRVEKEMTNRRIAQDASAELERQLHAAETRIMVETMNKSVFDQRVTDLEEKLREQERQTEEQVQIRRTAEDRLSEVQRLLRIASEEENRLREVNEEREQRIRTMEQANAKTSMKMALLEAGQTNATQSQSESTNKINALEADLKAVRQDNNYWRAEAERADETSRRNGGELAQALAENQHLQKSLSTLSMQLEENERLRETWRGKFLSLQEDMGSAAREIAEENARRIKKDQAMLARQEVLDARLQAEAKTRERLEVELDRLQTNERDGMRAVNECRRLEGILGEMRTENHKIQQQKLEMQRSLEDARETAASEVKRTRTVMQNEIDSAYHQVNVMREELEEQNSKLRAELDNFKLDADTIRAKNEMLLEDAETTKAAALDELKQKYQEQLEDMQAQYEQQRSVAVEEAHKTEENLLERLSFSASKIEHLQDRVLHLEEKLEISKEAAAAAAAAAKSAGMEAAAPVAITQTRSISRKDDLPEKISPQALRESIMVLQEQLQAREQRIEELEHNVAKMDPDAPSKISKRDDEISWLRELLAVRHGDLQDIITALSGEGFDRERVKDAAIRLKANLQMEEQERERALNGGSAIKLPNIAQSIQAAAASPRVAQTIGPLAAAWGNWRRANSGSFTSMSGRLNSPASRANATPSRSGPVPQTQNSQLGGLMTPPASGVRQSPEDNRPQPTAFSNTGRRLASQGGSGMSNRGRGWSNASRARDKMPAVDVPQGPEEELTEPMTPPMMRPAVYDSDAQPGDFDDDGFFED